MTLRRVAPSGTVPFPRPEKKVLRRSLPGSKIQDIVGSSISFPSTLPCGGSPKLGASQQPWRAKVLARLDVVCSAAASRDEEAFTTEWFPRPAVPVRAGSR